MTEETPQRLLPTGTCWCGCGAETGIGSFFTRGHDKIAEAAFIAARHGGSVARLLADNNFGPDAEVSVRAAALASGWIECPLGCGYAGAPASVRNHETKPHKEK
ncbi:hypothetical protein AB0D47_20705 [Streptomyces sp. NPDC048376]|uniref:hypothetical protein n=1 Tax=Streptomyces sp. NPDC048376 TaxID=3154926 RepID=UPI003434C26F